MRIILDLCGGTGAWSKPYLLNGYNVKVITLPSNDVRNPILLGSEEVYGILAAPPCTMFSLARTRAKKPRNIDEGLEIVKACLKHIWFFKPHFWAIENPKGLLRKYMGKPAFEFDASEFGSRYNKHTDLWGYFNAPIKTHKYIRYKSTNTNNRLLPPIPRDYVKDENMSNRAIQRSITPSGFANAFFKKNL